MDPGLKLMPLRRLVSRWLWRRLRRLAYEPSPAPHAGGISRYCAFRGKLHVAGSLDVPAPVRRLALELPGGELLPLGFDQANPRQIRFDQTLATPAPAAELVQTELVATLADGRTVRRSGLGNAVDDPAHHLANRFRALLAERPPGSRLLEIGARARSGHVRRDWVPPGWTYSGFDIMPGPNVDTIGDAHALSRHYPPDSFDAVMALSVLEHLLMPWKFILELNRVLRPGAIGLFTTHQSWPLHDQPWDFWRFSDTAWTGLLNPATGFAIVDAKLGEPGYIVPRRLSASTAFAERAEVALASFVLFEKTGPTTLAWPVELADILPTSYPHGETTA